MKTKEENLFQTYLSKIINSAFESGLVEREKRFKPEIISKDLLDIINHIKTKTREETIRAVEERLPKAQKINKKDWLGLNYTLGDVKYREHQYSLLVLDILNKLKK